MRNSSIVERGLTPTLFRPFGPEILAGSLFVGGNSMIQNDGIPDAGIMFRVFLCIHSEFDNVMVGVPTIVEVKVRGNGVCAVVEAPVSVGSAGVWGAPND